MKMNGSGCVFEFYGRVPATVYKPASTDFSSPLEQAVITNNVKELANLLKEGNVASVTLKVGEMTCIEYAAMLGYSEVIKLLIQFSRNAQTLNKYFAISDVVERAYMISKNKSLFFGPDGALAEANRYEAALFTAVEYNQPGCVSVLLDVLGTKEPNKHNFVVQNNQHESLSACELAATRGHKECYEILSKREWHSPVTMSLTRRTNRTTSTSERTE